MSHQSDVLAEPARTSWRARSYVAAWALLCAASVGYLTVLVVKPELVAFLDAREDPRVEESERAAAEAKAEAAGLRKALAQLQDHITELKSNLTATEIRERELVQKVAAFEQATQPPAAAAEPAAKSAAAKAAEAKAARKAAQQAAAQARAVAQAQQTAATTPPAPVITGPAAPAAPAAPAVNDAFVPPQARTVETSALAPAQPAPSAQKAAPAAPIAFGEPVVSRTAPAADTASYGVQIATGPSVDALRLSWTLLSERHGPALNKLQPKYTTGKGDNGSTYNLVAGPITSPQDAARVCAQLQIRGIACKVGDFAGEALQ